MYEPRRLTILRIEFPHSWYKEFVIWGLKAGILPSEGEKLMAIFVSGLLPLILSTVQARILGKSSTFDAVLMSVMRAVSYELSYDAYHRSLWS